MLQKIIIALSLIIFAILAVGFVVLAVWDIPVAQKQIEKPVDTSPFLNKKP